MKQYKLDEIIREYLIEIGENSLHKYSRVLRHAISGLREFNMDATGLPKIAVIDVSDNQTVPLPDDYISSIRVAVCDRDGNVHDIGINNNMCLPRHYDSCGDPVASNSNGQIEVMFWNTYEGGYFRNGENIGRYFGAGGTSNANGFYRIDHEMGFIALQSFVGEKVWLEYLADVSRSLDGDIMVHPYMVEPLKSWIHLKMIQRNLRVSGSDRQLAKLDYKEQYNIMTSRFTSFTVEEAKSTIRKTFMQAPHT